MTTILLKHKAYCECGEVARFEDWSGVLQCRDCADEYEFEQGRETVVGFLVYEEECND